MTHRQIIMQTKRVILNQSSLNKAFPINPPRFDLAFGFGFGLAVQIGTRTLGQLN